MKKLYNKRKNKQINPRKEKEKLICKADNIDEDPKVPMIALMENQTHDSSFVPEWKPHFFHS